MNTIPLPSVILLTIIVGFIVWRKFRPIVVISEDEAMVIERMGVYNRTLTHGGHWIWPIIESARSFEWLKKKGGPEVHRIKVIETIQDIIQIECVTRDSVKVSIDIDVHYVVKDPSKISYEVSNLVDLMDSLIVTSLSETIKSLTLDDIDQNKINQGMMSRNGKNVWSKYGIEILKCSLKHC